MNKKKVTFSYRLPLNRGDCLGRLPLNRGDCLDRLPLNRGDCLGRLPLNRGDCLGRFYCSIHMISSMTRQEKVTF